MIKIVKKSRRRLIVAKKYDDEDIIKTRATSQFRVVIHKKPRTIEVVCGNIRGSVGLL